MLERAPQPRRVRRADLTDEAFAGATSPWAAPGASPKTERVALYRSAFLDAFTRTPPWLPCALVLPVEALFIARGLPLVSARPIVALGLFGLGAVTWTLVEYLMHRFLFHAPVTSETGRIVTFLAHGHHHVYPQDRRRIAATPLQIGSLSLLFWGGFDLTLGAAAPIAMAGTLAAYLAYEVVHWRAHHGRPTTALGRALRRHHLAHHHVDPRFRWGIGSPLWDIVFRTMGPPSASGGSGDGERDVRTPGSAP